MGYIYALSLFGKNLSAGLYRHDVEPLVMNRPEKVSNVDEVALSSKIAVMGLNAFTKTESKEIVFTLPLYYDFHNRQKIKAALSENGVDVKRFIPNTTAVALYYATMCKEDEVVLVVINDGIGFSIGLYELGGGIIEALIQTYFKHNFSIIDWRYLLKVHKASHFFYIGEQNEMGTCVCQEIEALKESLVPDMKSSIHSGIAPEIKPTSWITFGTAVQAGIMNNELDCLVLLESICGSLCMLSEKTFMCDIIEKDSNIPCKRSLNITTTRDFQTTMFVKLFLRSPNEKCELMQENELPVLSYWVHGIKEGKRGEAKVEITVDVDANHIINVIFRDKETNKKLETVSHQHMFSLVSNMSKEELEQYRPALHYEKDEEVI